MVTKFPRFELAQISWLILHNQLALTKFRRGLQYSGTPPYLHLSDTITSLLRSLFFLAQQNGHTFPYKKKNINAVTRKYGQRPHFKIPNSKISYNVWFQKISIPLPRMVLSIRPPHPLRISVPEGLCITPIPPRISYIPFHGLNLPYLEIIDCVPLKINCSHLKTHFFYNLWPICNLLQGNMYFLRR